MTLPHATHTARTDVDALQSQFLRDPQRAMGWSGEGNRGWPAQSRSDPVGMRPLQPGEFVEQALSPIGLVVTANLVELLAAVADELCRLC